MGSVREYQLQFEKLLSRVGELSSAHQLGCFISGLKEPTRTDVQAEAIGLARLYESRHQATQNILGVNIKEPEPPLPSSSLTRTQEPVVKRLSPTELQARRDRGLCFNCDERFMPGHRCKKLFLLEGIYPEEKEPGGDDYGHQGDAGAHFDFK